MPFRITRKLGRLALSAIMAFDAALIGTGGLMAAGIVPGHCAMTGNLAAGTVDHRVYPSAIFGMDAGRHRLENTIGAATIKPLVETP